MDCVRIHTKQPLVHLDAMSESCALIEGVEGEFLDFTSLPRTMGLMYGFDMLTILSGMLSLVGELRQGHQRRSELPPFGCHGISLLTTVYVEYPHQCRHLLPLPVGLHGSWQADEAVIGGLGTCAEVPLAGEVNVLLCLHAFHASGKKETDEGQELFHRCFR